MKSGMFRWNMACYMKHDCVCMYFVWLTHKVFQMYVATVGWQPPASMSADWTPCPWTDAGGNLQVAVGDALRFAMTKFSFKNKLSWKIILFWIFCHKNYCFYYSAMANWKNARKRFQILLFIFHGNFTFIYIAILPTTQLLLPIFYMIFSFKFPLLYSMPNTYICQGNFYLYIYVI